MPKTKKQEIGELGEDMACVFLMKQGFEIMDRNYWKPWGEIDIIAKKGKNVHFVEVKSVSYETLEPVPHETDAYRPEENVHHHKLKRLGRTIQTYFTEKDIDIETEWQFDVLAVFLNKETRKAKFRYTDNVLL